MFTRGGGRGGSCLFPPHYFSHLNPPCSARCLSLRNRKPPHPLQGPHQPGLREPFCKQEPLQSWRPGLPSVLARRPASVVSDSRIIPANVLFTCHSGRSREGSPRKQRRPPAVPSSRPPPGLPAGPLTCCSPILQYCERRRRRKASGAARLPRKGRLGWREGEHLQNQERGGWGYGLFFFFSFGNASP